MKRVIYLTHKSHRTMTTLFLMAGSVEVSNSRARAATTFLARSSCCRHSLPVNERNLTFYFIRAVLRENLSLEFPTRPNTSQAVQPQKMVKGLKFRI